MIVLAAAAHPDDIEFMMAGTLLRLGDAGCEVHLWTLANGCCGSNTLGREETAATLRVQLGQSMFDLRAHQQQAAQARVAGLQIANLGLDFGQR